MIELLFWVCTLLEGQRCREEKLTFQAETVSIFECMHYGQFEMARWAGEHPNWRISPTERWTCQPAGQTANL